MTNNVAKRRDNDKQCLKRLVRLIAKCNAMLDGVNGHPPSEAERRRAIQARDTAVARAAYLTGHAPSARDAHRAREARQATEARLTAHAASAPVLARGQYYLAHMPVGAMFRVPHADREYARVLASKYKQDHPRWNYVTRMVGEYLVIARLPNDK